MHSSAWGKRQREDQEDTSLSSNANEGKLARMHNAARSAFQFRWEYEDANESCPEMTRASTASRPLTDMCVCLVNETYAD